MRPAVLAVAALAVVLSLSACGRTKLKAPALAEEGIGPAVVPAKVPGAGVSLKVPRGSRIRQLRRPGLFRVGVSTGFVSGFAYTRSEPLPKGPAELRAARRRLVAQVKRRDERFRVSSSRVTEVGGVPAVEVEGTQVIARQTLRTRSLHLYKGKVEYVVELLVPPSVFARVNRVTFTSLLDSLRVTGRLKAAPAKKR